MAPHILLIDRGESVVSGALISWPRIRSVIAHQWEMSAESTHDQPPWPHPHRPWRQLGPVTGARIPALVKGDFRGIKLSNKTHCSSSDPVDAVFSEGVALLAQKSKAHPAQLSYRGHALMDNRHDLIVDCRVTQATGTGERDAAKTQSSPQE